MLALSRHVNERVFIGPPGNPLIVISVVSINGDKVRLGFEAPTGLQIHREEVAKDIVAGIHHNSGAKK